MSVAIAGGTGNLGQYIVSACISTPFRGSFAGVKVLTRTPDSPVGRSFTHNGAEVVAAPLAGASTDIKKIASLLTDVHVLIDVQSGGPEGHRNKDALLAAAKAAGVKYYVLSEFGIDHRQIDFEHPEWDAKKEREKTARAIHEMHVISVYPGLFLEDSFGPWFGFDTQKGVWEAVGSSSSPFSLTSKIDLGLSIASIASLCIRGAPPPSHIRIAGLTTTASKAAATFDAAKNHEHHRLSLPHPHGGGHSGGHGGGLVDKIVEHLPGHHHSHEPSASHDSATSGSHASGSEKQTTKVETVPLDEFKAKAIGDGKADPAAYLRFIIGEGKLDHSKDCQNEAVNPGEQGWKWTTLEEYAKKVHGRPWCSDTPEDARTPLEQVRDKIHIPDRTHSHFTADVGQSQEQSERHTRINDALQKTSLP